MFKDIYDWFWAVMEQWQVLMTGGIVSAISTAIESWREQSFSWSISKWILISFAVAAFFLAWRSERNKFRPIIKADIDQINFHPTPNVPNSTSILLVVAIKNTGDQTALDQWALSILFPDGTKRNGRLKLIPTNELTLQGDTGIQKFSGKDALYNKALNPINKGQIIRGIIWFSIDNVIVSSFQIGTELDLTFKDVVGTEYHTTQKIRKEGGPPSYFPGLSMESR